MFIELNELLINVEQIKLVTFNRINRKIIFEMGSFREFYECKDIEEFEVKIINLRKAICDINFGTHIIKI